MFKVGDRVHSKKYGDGTVISASNNKEDVLPLSVNFYHLGYTLFCGDTERAREYKVERIREIKVGDTVRLIDKYYEHEDFKKVSRCERKRVSDFKGKSAVCDRESFIDGWMNVKTAGYYESIPSSLLERVEPKAKEEPSIADRFASIPERLVKRHAKVGEKIRIVEEWASGGRYQNGDLLTVLKDSDSGFGVHAETMCGKEYISDSEYLVIESGKHVYTDEQKAEALRIATEILNENYKQNTIPNKETVVKLWGGKIGKSKCAPTDEYAYEIGLMVACCHATGRKLPEWIK